MSEHRLNPNDRAILSVADVAQPSYRSSSDAADRGVGRRSIR